MLRAGWAKVSEKGFTLFEVILVMGIITLLLGLGLGVWQIQQNSAHNTRAKSNLLTAHNAALNEYEQSLAFTNDATQLAALSEDLPEYKYTTNTPPSLNKKPTNIWLDVPSSDEISMCVQSAADRVFCVRSAMQKGIAITDSNGKAGYVQDVRAEGDSYSEVMSIIKPASGAVNATKLGWKGDKAITLTDAGEAPGIRLTCELLPGDIALPGDATYKYKCPDIVTSDDFAYFEWATTTGWNAPDKVTCKLDGADFATVTGTTCSANLAQGTGFAKIPPSILNTDLGEHTFTVTASKDSSGSASTSYVWNIIPGLPKVILDQTDPDITPVGSKYETTKRNSTFHWDATNPTVTGNLEEVYCKVEEPNPDGTYTTTYDGKCLNSSNANWASKASGTKPTTKHWMGDFYLPTPPEDRLAFHNTVPHHITVTAVNEAGASEEAEFNWYVVDRTPPIIDPTPDPDPGTNTTITGAGEICYSPTGSVGAVINIKTRAHDPESGLEEVRFPALTTRVIGTSSAVNGIASVIQSDPDLMENMNYPPTTHTSLGTKPNMYKIGSGGTAGHDEVNEFFILIHNGAPPYTNMPANGSDALSASQAEVISKSRFAFRADTTGPNPPSVSTDESNTAINTWSTQDNRTYTVAFTSDSGCANFDHHQYRYALNGGGFSGWHNFGNGNNGDGVNSPNSTQVTTGYEGRTRFQFRSYDTANNPGTETGDYYTEIDTLAPPVPSSVYVRAAGTDDANTNYISGGNYAYSNYSQETLDGGGINGAGGWTNQKNRVDAVAVSDTNAPYSSGIQKYQYCFTAGSDIGGCPVDGSTYTWDSKGEQGISSIHYRAVDNLNHSSGFGNALQVAYDTDQPSRPITPEITNIRAGAETGPGDAVYGQYNHGHISSSYTDLTFTTSSSDLNPYGVGNISGVNKVSWGSCRWGNEGTTRSNSVACDSNAGATFNKGFTYTFSNICGDTIYYACSVGNYSASARVVDKAGNWNLVVGGSLDSPSGEASTNVKANAALCLGGACGWVGGDPGAGSYTTPATEWGTYTGAAGVANAPSVAHHGTNATVLTFAAAGRAAYIAISGGGACSAEFKAATAAAGEAFYMGFVTTGSSNTEPLPSTSNAIEAKAWRHISFHPDSTGFSASRRFVIMSKGAATLYLDDLGVSCET